MENENNFIMPQYEYPNNQQTQGNANLNTQNTKDTYSTILQGWKTFNFDQINGISNNDSKEVTISKTTPKRHFKTFNFEEQIEPKTVDDLAVHSKKINDVELWLNSNVLSKKPEQQSSILLVTGPTGCGKTVSVKVLCKKLNIEVSEWINPVDKDSDYVIGQISQLLGFLSESKYPSLLSITKPKVIVIEDFPNAVIHDPSNFINVLEKCKNCKNSVIFIGTDASNLNLNLPEILFPDEVRRQFNIHTISFNSTSNTLMKRALKRAQTLLENGSDIGNIPDQLEIENIISASMGDIRCAINQFYFTCRKVPAVSVSQDVSFNTPPNKAGNKRKRKPKHNVKSGTAMVKTERLSFFHSLGRVLNPKQEEKNGSWRLQCDVGALVDEISIQPASFNSFLHANYIKYFGNVDDVRDAAEILSFSQNYLNKWENRFDILKYGLWVPILGLMVHNKNKVSKWNQITGPRKYKKTINNDFDTKPFNIIDHCYYNIINKFDSKNSFKVCL